MKLWALALVLASTPAAAQSRAQLIERGSVAEMKLDLRRLVTEQEAWSAGMGGLYTDDLRELRFIETPGVTVMVFQVARNRYQARAVHVLLPGRSCVTFVGRDTPSPPLLTDRDRKPAMSGEISCDE